MVKQARQARFSQHDSTWRRETDVIHRCNPSRKRLHPSNNEIAAAAFSAERAASTIRLEIFTAAITTRLVISLIFNAPME